MTDGDRCSTCGRPRGLEQRRDSWSIHPLPGVPRTKNPEDQPDQIHNDLRCVVQVYRNGGVGQRTHLCNECLRVALRVIKAEVSEALQDVDADHDLGAELVELTERLASLQLQYSNLVHDHDRMQGRLSDALKYIRSDADPDVVEMATWEAGRGKAKAVR